MQKLGISIIEIRIKVIITFYMGDVLAMYLFLLFSKAHNNNCKLDPLLAK